MMIAYGGHVALPYHFPTGRKLRAASHREVGAIRRRLPLLKSSDLN
ncbi:hypothetical protein [Nostoc flagelliforme]